MVYRSLSTSDMSNNSTSPSFDVNSSNSNALLAGIKWDIENDVFLADFIEKNPLPHLAVITKGQYLNVGAPNVANPGLKPYILLYERKTVHKVLAEVMRSKDTGRKGSMGDQKVAIPENYDGFFEILSEDGRPTKCIESVKDLYRIFPESCLVRSPMKAYLQDDEGKLTRVMAKSRQLEGGELLTLVGQFNYKKTAYLRCFDETGQSVYLKMSQKGKFSPIAHKENISGVHYVANLMETKRFPLMVRLIQGQFPQDPKLSSNSINLKLKTIFQEDIVVAYILQKDGEFVTIPLNSYLKVAPSRNHSLILSKPEFRAICDFCDQSIPAHVNRITAFNDQHVVLTPPTRSMENLTELEADPKTEPSDQAKSSPVVNDDEIDQLYDYIRGFTPLPSSCYYQKPPPPAIDTLPSKTSDEASLEKIGGKPRTRTHSREAKHAKGPEPDIIRHKPDRRYKSTEKLLHPSNQTSGDHIGRPGHVGHGRKRLPSGARARPFSMVVPDNVHLFPYGPQFDTPLHQHPMYSSSQRFPSANHLYFYDEPQVSDMRGSHHNLAVIGGPPPPYVAYPSKQQPLYHRYPMLHRY